MPPPIIPIMDGPMSSDRRRRLTALPRIGRRQADKRPGHGLDRGRLRRVDLEAHQGPGAAPHHASHHSAHHAAHHPVVGGCFEHGGLAVGEVDQNLEAFARGNHQRCHRNRRRQVAAVRGNDMESPPIIETQIEVSRIGGIEEAQAHEPRGRLGDRCDHAVDDQGVAAHAHHA
jgi:hypothetical protein